VYWETELAASTGLGLQYAKNGMSNMFVLQGNHQIYEEFMNIKCGANTLVYTPVRHKANSRKFDAYMCMKRTPFLP